MGRMLKSVAPYWKSVCIIMIFLFLQAYCDLSLPQYTSKIIDTGIQNGGVEHVLPEKITSEEYELAKLFMTEEEVGQFDEVYAQEQDVYVLQEKKNKKLDELDDTFAIAMVLNHQMSAVTETQFKAQIAGQFANQPGFDASMLDTMSLEQLGQMMGMSIPTFTKEQENDNGELVENTYIDMRKILQGMIDSGRMKQEDIITMRNQIETQFESMGESMVKSMAIAYALDMDERAGVDMDRLQTSYMWYAGFRMVVMALAMAFATVMVGFVASKVGAGIGRDLRGAVYEKVMKFSNAEMDKFSTASLITRTTNDVQQIQLVIVLTLRMILYAPILGIGGVIRVFQTGAGMEWIIGLAVLVILALVMLLMVIAMPKFKLMQKLVDAVNLVSREILTGLSVIRAFGREDKEEQRFDEANKRLTKTTLFTNRVMTFMMPSMTMIMYGISVLIVWVSTNKIDEGSLQVGAMTAFITYTMQIVMSFLMLTMMSIMLPRAAVAAERIDEVLKTEITVNDSKQAKDIHTTQGVLAFHHVDFAYPGAVENALTDIDFVAEPGKTTAIIGSTGCGKSTVVNLIPRLYDVTNGQITLDGEDIRNISMESLRELLGYVPQKGILFSGDIASNLRFGKEDATDAQIEEAADIAQATEFIESKQARYESPIAQGGSNVSGGQKQRLSIARAIAKDPKIYIFDDSFSALDLKTDAALRKALEPKVKDRTVIIVAQRISTILHADQILVMDDGRIVGKGTHEELLKSCEVYQQIATSQLSEKELGITDENASGKEE